MPLNWPPPRNWGIRLLRSKLICELLVMRGNRPSSKFPFWKRRSNLLLISFVMTFVAHYDIKKALADSYLDVLVSLKEKWEKKKAATDCEARLREVMANIDLFKEIMNNNLLASDELLRLRTKEVELGSELDVMAVSDFSAGKLDLPQISEDLPEDFFAKVPSAADDVTKCLGG